MPDVIFGAVLIVVLILLPTGIGGGLRKLFGPLTSRLYSKS
jgi:preprotein translocase subunit SecG